MPSIRTRTVRPRRLRRDHPQLPPGEVTMEQLKRDLAAGFAHFFGRRPHLHQPGVDAAGFNFVNRRSA